MGIAARGAAIPKWGITLKLTLAQISDNLHARMKRM